MSAEETKDVGFHRFADLNPETIAIVEQGGRECSRREFFDTSNRLAHALRSAGLASGDAIAVIAPNGIEYLAAYFAAVNGGWYFVPINWHIAAHEIAHILRDSDAKALIVHERFAQSVQETIAAHRLQLKILIAVGGAPDFAKFDNFIAGHPTTLPSSRERGRALAYTSATTGRPKAVRRSLLRTLSAQSQRQLFMPASMTASISSVTDNVHLCNSMLYHSPVLMLTATELDAGHRVVLMDTWSPETMLSLIERHRVTTTFMVPTMFIRLLKLAESARRRHDVSSLRIVLHSGAPCPVDIKRAMIDWWGRVLWERYGATEGPVTLVDSNDWLRYPGTVGRPEHGIEIKILDDDGTELPSDRIGVVYIRRQGGLDFEYKGDKEKTAAGRRGDYYTVGDMGYVNDAGFLFLCDRKIDMIISAGVNIYAAEIEQALVLHPAITDCAVVAAPHELLGEVPRALVQLAPGRDAGQPLTANIMLFLSKRLAPIKLPKRIDYVPHIPRDPNGKLYKRFLVSGADNVH